MKHAIFLFVLFSSVLGGANAQTSMPVATVQDIQMIQSLTKSPDQVDFGALRQQFPINRIHGRYVVSFVAKTDPTFDPAQLPVGIRLGSKIGRIATLQVPIEQLNQVFTLPGITYLELAGLVRPLLDKVVKDVRADSVHMGIDPLVPYTGKDVLIGVTDWGFDYTHPMFYDTAMTTSRILAAWDQYKQSGPSPANFSYGTEYASPQSLLAAGSDTANIYSYAYHGTHVAGIAGGGGAGTAFRGMAFEAEFLMATFLIDVASVLDAYAWMVQKAEALGKRLVINQSWGLHHVGTLDGTSLLSQAIDGYADLGVVFVSSGGNNGDVNFHIKKEFTTPDTLKTRVNFYSYSANANMFGQSVIAWGEPGHPFATSFQVTAGNGTVLGSIPFYHTTDNAAVWDSLFIASDTLVYAITTESAHAQNGRPHVRLRIKSENTNYRILLQVAAASGTVHAWNVTDLVTDVGNWGMPFSIATTGTVAGDNTHGISEPACAASTIAVAAYAAEYYTPGGTLVGGALAGFSSVGPTLDGRVKPDIAAPGVSVASAVSSFTDNNFSTATTVEFNGETYPFTRISGTSMSGPVVSGVVALMLDANPFLSVEQVKEIIQTTARTDSKTGVIPAGGSTKWGAGKLNAFAAVKLALNTVHTEELLLMDRSIVVFPNPAENEVFITGKGEKLIRYEVVNAVGMKVDMRVGQTDHIDVSMLAPGVYRLMLHFEDGIVIVPISKQGK